MLFVIMSEVLVNSDDVIKDISSAFMITSPSLLFSTSFNKIGVIGSSGLQLG